MSISIFHGMKKTRKNMEHGSFFYFHKGVGYIYIYPPRGNK
jgi:hypothetical protein